MVRTFCLMFPPKTDMTWDSWDIPQVENPWTFGCEPGAAAAHERQVWWAERTGSARAQMSQVGESCQAPWSVLTLLRCFFSCLFNSYQHVILIIIARHWHPVNISQPSSIKGSSMRLPLTLIDQPIGISEVGWIQILSQFSYGMWACGSNPVTCIYIYIYMYICIYTYIYTRNICNIIRL